MLTTPRNQKLLFRSTVGVTLLLALLPWRGWTNDVAAVVSLPVELFGDGANVVLGWARPHREPLDGVPAEARPMIDQLVVERDLFQQQLRAAERHIEELTDVLEELQRVPLEDFRVPIAPLAARVTAQNADPLGPVRVMGGSARGVRPDTVAVCRGVQLLGRVIEVTRFTSLVLPITSPERIPHRFITALVHPGDAGDERRPPVAVQLDPMGDGTFVTQVDRSVGLAAGDEVTLNDPDWPESAQSRVIGQVTSVEPIDQDPLRNEVVVTPRYQLHQVSSVTLLVETGHAIAEGDLGNGGRP